MKLDHRPFDENSDWETSSQKQNADNFLCFIFDWCYCFCLTGLNVERFNRTYQDDNYCAKGTGIEISEENISQGWKGEFFLQ